MQENGSMVARGSTMMPIAAGKGVGGSTLINSALSFVHPMRFSTVGQHLLDDDSWSAQSLQPTYAEISEAIGVAVTSKAVSGRNNDLIVRGIEKLGVGRRIGTTVYTSMCRLWHLLLRLSQQWESQHEPLFTYQEHSSLIAPFKQKQR